MRDLLHHQTKQALKDSTHHGLRAFHGRARDKALPPAQTGGKTSRCTISFDPTSKRYAEAREFRGLYDSIRMPSV